MPTGRTSIIIAVTSMATGATTIRPTRATTIPAAAAWSGPITGRVASATIGIGTAITGIIVTIAITGATT